MSHLPINRFAGQDELLTTFEDLFDESAAVACDAIKLLPVNIRNNIIDKLESGENLTYFEIARVKVILRRGY